MRTFGRAIALFVTLCAGCSSEAATPLAFVVDALPDDFPSQPLFFCVNDELEGTDRGFFGGYRGTVADDSPPYTETAFLRLVAVDADAELAETLGLDGADPGSAESAVVNGQPATSFTISTAEPVLTPWPGFTWEQDGAVLTIIGEGMDDVEVLTAAESVRLATPAEVDDGGVIGSEECG